MTAIASNPALTLDIMLMSNYGSVLQSSILIRIISIDKHEQLKKSRNRSRFQFSERSNARPFLSSYQF